MDTDKGFHKTISIIKKYTEIKDSNESLVNFEKRCIPYEEKVIECNALIEAGVDILWTLACGGSATDYSSTNANIEVYITSAWDDTGTFDSGSYPVYGSDGKASWKSSWAGSDGDGPWTKWAVTNGTQHLNEKTYDIGAKSGGTWTLEVSITLT